MSERIGYNSHTPGQRSKLSDEYFPPTVVSQKIFGYMLHHVRSHHNINKKILLCFLKAIYCFTDHCKCFSPAVLSQKIFIYTSDYVRSYHSMKKMLLCFLKPDSSFYELL